MCFFFYLKIIKVWDRTPADSYKNTIPVSTPLFENLPSIKKLDDLIRNKLGDTDLEREKLYLVQVVQYTGSTNRGCHQDGFSSNVALKLILCNSSIFLLTQLL
jgi:hypothetical protein